MRILFLDSWLRDRAAGSGSAVAIAGLEQGLEALGHSVEVMRPRRRLPSLDLTRLHYNLGLQRRVTAVADRSDLVVGFDFDGWALEPNPRRRYVVALKGVAADERRFETGRHRARFALFSRLEGRNARSADRVVVTSRYSARAAIEAYGLDPARVRIVPEGLDEATLRRAAEPAGPAIADRDPVVLSVARQYRRKDTPTLLRAFAEVVRAVPAARLRVVGDGPELSASRGLADRLGISGHVTFTGSLATADELAGEYRRARVFCLPSRQEGFGIVFLEAMAHGLPIAAAEAGATPEVAPDGLASLLVPPADAAALTGALLRLLSDTELAARLGANGIQRARASNWPSVARTFLNQVAD